MKKLILIVPIVIVISVAAAVILSLLKYWLLGIAVLVLALILNWWSETFALNCFRQKMGRYDFRVLTYNINRAHQLSVNEGTTEELVEFILKQKADIVLLQEYNAELYPVIQEKLNREYMYVSGVDVTSRFKSVFSKFPIESCEQLMVNTNTPEYKTFQNRLYCKKQHNGIEILPICKMIIRIGNYRLQLFNCHLMSNNYSVVVRNCRKKKKSFIDVLLSVLHRMDFAYKAREVQVKVMSDKLDKENPSLLCGDFNDIGGSSCIRRLQRASLTDAWWEKGNGYGATFHGMGLRFRLDHILYSKDCLVLRKIFVPYSNLSDHSPLLGDFIIKR